MPLDPRPACRRPDTRAPSTRLLSSGALLVIAALAFPAIAEDSTNYDEPGITHGREYLAQHFAERIDPFTGNLSLQFEDLRIPGNAGFDLRVIRSYNANATGTALSPFGRGWDMHFGRVTLRPDQTCSGATPQTMTLELPDGSRQTLHRSNGVASTSTTDYLTTSFWKGQCIAAGGMNVFSPEGTRYEMTEIDTGVMHAKRIVDRFGNTLTLTYALNTQTGRRVVTAAQANDGRAVTFSYSAGKLTSVSGGGTTWGYTVTTATDGSGSYQLTRVTPPAGDRWEFAYNGNLGTSAGSYLLRQVVNPYGGSTTYAYDRVSFLAVLGAPPTTVVKTKTAGSDTWGYAYQPGCAGSGNDKTTVTLPDGIGTVTYEHFGYCTVDAGTVWKIGLLDRKTTGNVQTETLTWVSQAISNESVVRPGYLKLDSQVFRPLLAARVVTRDSLAHSTSFSSFDGYGNPLVVTENGNRSRSTSLTYFNSTPLWIIGLPNNETIADVGSITRTRGGAGELLSESRYGVSTTYTYHPDGSPWTRRDANSNTTTFTNWLYGTARTEQRPEGVTISRTVDASGNLASQTDGEYMWQYDYDGIGRLIFVNYPAGLDATITWGSTTRTMTRGTLNETTSFDAFGRVSSISREGIMRTFRHDALGRTTFESLPGSAQGTTTSYDIIGRVKSIAFPVGARSHAYTAGAMTVLDERNHATTFEYDRYGDPDGGYLRRIAAPVGTASVTINRNKIGVVTSVVQNGITRTIGRDSRFFLTSVTEPESGTTTYGRDAVGNMTSRTIAGQTVNHAYDGLHRLKSLSGPAISVSLGYDRRGKVTSVANSVATREYAYDANGNLSQDKLTIDGATFTVDYAHDGLDGLASITYPLSKGAVTYTPDALGRPTRAAPYLSNVTHRDSGNLGSITYANGIVQTYGENSRQLPSSIQAGAISLGLGYAYDDAGNVSSITDTYGTGLQRTLGYDGINRLTSASGSWGVGTITYDGQGNIERQSLGAHVINYGYAGNRLASITGSAARSYSYDGAGNMTSNGVLTFSHDALSQLKCVACGSASEIGYQYDGQGRRVSQDVAGRRTYFIHAPNGDLQFEYTPHGKRWTKHAYLHGKRVASEAGSDALATTITVSASPAAPVYAQPLTITTTIAPAAATGTVEFLEAGSSLGVANVVTGLASISVPGLGVGVRSVTAIYSGDAVHQPGTASLSVTVAKRSATVSLTGAPSSAGLGQSITLGASVSGASPTGQVEFRDGVQVIGTATLVNGTASLATGALMSGTHGFTAAYLGDMNHDAATSASAATLVAKSAPIVTLSSSAPSSVTGQSVTFAAMIAGAPGVIPGGTVTFRDGATALGSAGVTSGSASFTTSVLTAGSHSISATYGGDANYDAAVSAPVAQAVVASNAEGVLQHYYLSVLGRPADPEGWAYHLSEVERMAGLLVKRQETLRVIAKYFFFSPEYVARNRTDAQFVEDLYWTFYQRAPEDAGRTFWLSQIGGGLNREAVVLAFMFSPEFASFMSAAVPDAFVQRPETELAMDAYRAAFMRIPDSPGFIHWRGTISTAQCNGTVHTAASALISIFFGSPEYLARGRSNRQYVADLYDVFFRRAPDVAGFNYWVAELDALARTRQGVIDAFFGSVEWTDRVNAITAAGCQP